MQPFSGNQRPDLLTALMNMSLILRLPRKMHLCRSSSNVARMPSFLVPRVVRTWCASCILTSKCASRHNGVQFSYLIWPAGSAPADLASLLFDPPEPQIIWKTQCFATALLPFRAPGSSFFWIFFLLRLSLFWDFIFFDLLSSSLLFSSLLFASLLFSSLLFSSLLFSSLLFSSLTLTTSAFHLSILSEVWLLKFLRLLYTLDNNWTFFSKQCLSMQNFPAGVLFVGAVSIGGHTSPPLGRRCILGLHLLAVFLGLCHKICIPTPCWIS